MTSTVPLWQAVLVVVLSGFVQFIASWYQNFRARKQLKLDQRAIDLKLEITTVENDAIRYHSSALNFDEQKTLEKQIKARLKIIGQSRESLEREANKVELSTKSIMIRFRQASTLTDFEGISKKPSFELIDEIMVSSAEFRAKIDQQVE